MAVLGAGGMGLHLCVSGMNVTLATGASCDLVGPGHVASVTSAFLEAVAIASPYSPCCVLLGAGLWVPWEHPQR